MRTVTILGALVVAMVLSTGAAFASPAVSNPAGPNPAGPADAKTKPAAAPAAPKNAAPKNAAAKSPEAKAAPKKAVKKATLRRRMPRPQNGLPTSRTIRTMLRQAAKSLPIKSLKIRTSEVYYGNYRRFQRAAVIDVQKVFNAIPAYRQLKRLGLNKKSGRYWVLMQRSNRVFHRALRKIAKDKHYQLIGAKGAIVIDGKDPTDVTGDILKMLPKVRK